MSYWSVFYIVALGVLFGLSIGKRNRNYIIIASASMVAFVITRLISEVVTGDRYMFDVANDLLVMGVLVLAMGFKPIVLWLISTYIAMIYFSYIPYSEGNLNMDANFIIVSIIGKIQIILLFLGIYHENILTGLGRFSGGRVAIESYANLHSQLHTMANIGRTYFYSLRGDLEKEPYTVNVVCTDKHDKEHSKQVTPFKSGTYAHLAKGD